jgi:hypothetical protein
MIAELLTGDKRHPEPASTYSDDGGKAICAETLYNIYVHAPDHKSWKRVQAKR